jgi:hypothetical protein
MLKHLLVTLLLFSGLASYGQFGLYASAAYINVNGSISFYNNTAPGLGQDIGSTSFQGADFGLFEQNSGNLKLVGSEIKTYKGIADNVCGGKLNYTVYPLGARPASPVYSSIDLGFYSDCFAPACGSFFGAFNLAAGGGCCSDRDQKWQNPGFGVSANIDLTANSIGVYTLEMYYSFTGEDAGNGCGTTKYDNNNNAPANYTASFTITAASPVSFGNIRLVNKKWLNTIQWNTLSEENTNNFNIQRSANGTDFYNIGSCVAAGFSSTVKNYAFNDNKPLNGINYYRIRMNEPGGKFQHSVIISTNNTIKQKGSLINNSAGNTIQLININKGDQVILYNSLGAEVKRQTAKNSTLDMSSHDLTSGIYFLKILNSDGAYVLPLRVIHL